MSDAAALLFNKSIDLGTFPSKLKMQKLYQILNLMITRILITTDQYLHYLALDRIFEKLVYKRMKSFIEENNILCTSYGFKQGHSTEHAILDIVSRIQSKSPSKYVNVFGM